MGKGRVVYRVLMGKPEGKRPPGTHLGGAGLDGRILGWIFRKLDVGYGLD
jgi:hypothetical protein